MVVAREGDEACLSACRPFHDEETALCTRVERDFLRTLLGGCSTPISALAEVHKNELYFKGNILSVDGKQKVEIEKSLSSAQAGDLGRTAAQEILEKGGREIAEAIRYAGNQD
jgi:hydroxymethylbilane synthase